MSEKFPNVSRPILADAVSMAVLGGCAVSDYQRPTLERVGAGDGEDGEHQDLRGGRLAICSRCRVKACSSALAAKGWAFAIR